MNVMGNPSRHAFNFGGSAYGPVVDVCIYRFVNASHQIVADNWQITSVRLPLREQRHNPAQWRKVVPVWFSPLPCAQTLVLSFLASDLRVVGAIVDSVQGVIASSRQPISLAFPQQA